METKPVKKSKKVILTVSALAVLFAVYIINGINEHTVIPDHIHSIDDKAPEERTDEDNIIILERTIQNEPDNVQAMIEVSELYIKTDDKKSAKKILEKALAIDPYNKIAGERLKQLD
ncbi:MAG TPA: tetratricopeptide repeat protein [Ignavibacteria bacterium]|nr:tetratricopeptide repeat protein [Ignavibacteria bacterium]HMR40516.1 tetratricopeptide repeat protein [Ignavibacteria bacterium]